jgi:hypothetical protein
MWNRRRFLEMVSGLPLVAGAIGASTGVWMMRSGDEKIVARRLRQVRFGAPGPRG